MHDIVIENDVPATMRDGTVLRADVYRPIERGPWPVLLSRLPYGKATAMTHQLLEPVLLARNGFIVVLQDTRGRFASEGAWEPWTFEEHDGFDTVEWAAGLPDSDGAVVMFGMSYLGNTQWMAAASRPPSLRAIMPEITWADPEDGLYSRGGALELGGGLPWSLAQGIDTTLRRAKNDPEAGQQQLHDLISEIDRVDTVGYWEGPVDAHPAFARHNIADIGLVRSRRDPEWTSTSRVASRYDDILVPSLNIGGWYDKFSQGTLDNFTAMAARGTRANLIMGPWAHLPFGTPRLGDVNFGLASTADVLGFRGRLTELKMRWARQQLAASGSPADGPDLPPVLLFVMGSDQWREEQEWPLSRAVETAAFLREGGLLSLAAPTSTEASSHFVHDPADPVRTTGGALMMSGAYRPGPVDQAPVEARPDVLVFTGDALTDDVEVTGRVRAVVHFVTEASTTDWVVRLCDVDPQGVSVNVVDGIRRVSATPGEPGQCEVDLWSTSYVFRAGHRIRVHVGSSNFPRWDRAPIEFEDGRARHAPPVDQQVLHGVNTPTRVILPVVGSHT